MRTKIAAAVAASMLAATLPHVSAAETLIISDAASFAEFVNMVNSGKTETDARLAADINVSEICASGDLVPAGTETNPYSGSFDGGGHTISGLHISGGDGNAALFGYIGEAGIVSDLTIEGAVTGAGAGGAASVNLGIIDGVKSNVSVLGSEKSGGICAENKGTIKNSENTGSVYALNEGSGGGICSENYGSISSCANYGAVNGSEGGSFSVYLGGIAGYSEGSVSDSSNAGTVIGGEYTAGGVGYSDKSYSLKNIRNFGEVTGLRGFTAGAAAYLGKDGAAAQLENYGSITGTGTNTGGIAADTAVTISAASNRGDISGADYTAGIAAVSRAGITDSVNYGKINCSSSYAAGITAQSAGGTIENCRNAGKVECAAHYAAGIAALAENTKIARCFNTGNIMGAVSGTGNFTAGIAAKTTAVEVYDCASVGIVTGVDTVGGVIGYKDGTVRGAFKYDGYEGAVLNDINPEATEYVYSYADYDYPTENAGKFATGEIAWMLNTRGGTVTNSGIWSQGKRTPVPADENHEPVRKIVCRLDGAEQAYFTDANGCIPSDNMTQNENAQFFDENGMQTTPSFEPEAKSGAVYVSTAAELIEAAGNAGISEITLLNDISMTIGVTFKRDITINGDGNRIAFSSGELSVRDGASAVLKSLSVKADGFAVTAIESSVTTDSFLDVTQSGGIRLLNSSLNINGKLFGPSVNGAGDITASGNSSVTGADDYNISEGIYSRYTEPKLDFAWDIVIPAAENDLPYDLYPEVIGDTVYFFMPCTADLTDVTYRTVSMSGDTIEEFKNINLSGTSSETADIRMKEYKIRAMQSELPTVQFWIDEQHGTIDDMNSSADHSQKCYGDVRIDITEEYATKTGKESFVSVENDEDSPGTVEIRGRGNSTWTSDLNEKKPYQFKLEKKGDILGMGKDKTWILLKNSSHHIKNKLGFDTAQAVGLEFTNDSEFVDLFMNGEYLGTYLLTEKVEIAKNRVDITDIDEVIESDGLTPETDLTGGYLLEIDNTWGEQLQITYDGTVLVTVQSPEDIADTVSPDNEYSYIYNIVNGLLDAVYGNGLMPDGRSYIEYIDTESFAKYFWVEEFLKNGDCGRGSTFMYKDSDSVDPLIYAGPVWDHDRILEGNYPEGWYLRTIDVAGTEYSTFYKQLSTRMDFVKYLIYYYEEAGLSEIFAHIHEYIDEYEGLLADSAAMNSVRWGLNDFYIEWYEELLVNRAEWVDKNYLTLLDYVTDRQAVEGYITQGEIVAEFNNLNSEALSLTMRIEQFDADGNSVSVEELPASVRSGSSRTEVRTNADERCASFIVTAFNNETGEQYNSSEMYLKNSGSTD